MKTRNVTARALCATMTVTVNDTAAAVSVGCLLVWALITLWTSVCTFVLWVCWNALIAGLFHGPALSFWQAGAVIVVLAVLSGAVASLSKNPEQSAEHAEEEETI